MKTEEIDLTKVYNEMIALWMGVKHVWVHPKFGVYEAEDEQGTIDWVDVGIRSLNYHQDLSLLMSVVYRISEYRLAFPEETSKVCDCKIVVDRRVLFERVVQFIQWHNKQETL